ncbi:hypothetical protein B0T16DRAFT_334647 [Cercophora newfieldiana]|uniref:Uncharacterized protein n=1 Tax=Cercophora newfieldiana TaxID=92897 RepID=A0AA40CLM2_9PEZI|nr:hypothetical protein B0T16DRAFT_334647 [Cercophora newfieldiana]
MPVPVAAKAGIIVASVAVAAAIALYESPEVRRVAEDLRRRIALALHALGDNLDPDRPDREPVFNRPEDAEGFLQSRGTLGAESGVDADEETRRRQREELMYWNSLREEKERRESQQAAAQQQSRSRSLSLTFDDFLKEDKNAERGTFVYNTGASPWGDDQQGLVRRRGPEGVRGLNASMIANPFADEYGIELDDHPGMQAEPHALSPGQDEVMSDIYNATPRDGRSAASHTLSPQSKPVVPDILFDFDSSRQSESATLDSATVDEQQFQTPPASSHGAATLEHELADVASSISGQEERDAYASIQAWARGSNPGFYSPLPDSPAAPLSEAELISEGALTPTYSASLAGSGVDVALDAASSRGGDFDIMSEDGSAIPTPNSWSEVGSVISESDGVHA